MTGFAVWQLDRHTFNSVKTSRRLSAGAIVQNSTAQFSLRVPTGGWERVGPGAIGDGTEELGLRTQRGEVWVVVYAHPVAGTSLDGVVASRRGIVQQERSCCRRLMNSASSWTARIWSPPPSRAIACAFRARVGSFLVFTTIVGDRFVEVVGFAFDASEADVTQLVRSLKQGVQRS